MVCAKLSQVKMLWLPEWTAEWHYAPDGRRWRINPRKHLLHRLGSTPGVDVGVYAYWRARHVRLMYFVFREGMVRPHDGAIGLVAAMSTFDVVKMPVDGGEYGMQWAVPRDAAHVWHPILYAEEADAVIAEVMALAYGAA